MSGIGRLGADELIETKVYSVCCWENGPGYWGEGKELKNLWQIQ